jgi:hypothetical protein
MQTDFDPAISLGGHATVLERSGSPLPRLWRRSA